MLKGVAGWKRRDLGVFNQLSQVMFWNVGRHFEGTKYFHSGILSKISFANFPTIFGGSHNTFFKLDLARS